MDIRLLAARVVIFIVVYTFVLAPAFILGSRYRLWELATYITVFFASLGYFVYTYLVCRVEYCLFFKERKGRQFILRALDRLIRIRSVKKLASYVVHLASMGFRTENSAVFFLDSESKAYKLESVRLGSKCAYAQSLSYDDLLIKGLSCRSRLRVYEEVVLEARKQKGKAIEVALMMKALSIAVIIPICLKDEVLGFLMLGDKKPSGRYPPEDLSALYALSNQTAYALDNARFCEKAQEKFLNEDWNLMGHGISHQFGNVLNRIIQRSSGKEADIEDMDVDNAPIDELKRIILELKENFQAITHTGLQGKEIVSGILALGSQLALNLTQSDLVTVIKKSIQHFELKYLKAKSITEPFTAKGAQEAGLGLEITVNIPDDLPKISCDSLQIEQVLDNMLDNAFEAIEEKQGLIKRGELNCGNVFYGNILIKGEVSGGQVFLEISDNGIGMGSEEQKKLFTPFFTTKKSGRLSRKGHGIGMHMVKKIIQAHQGRIYIVQSEYGQGTTFKIELPIS